MNMSSDLRCRSCGHGVGLSARFCSHCGTPLVGAGQAGRSFDSVEEARSELRQVTVVVCDMVDSTSIANRLEPEDVHGIFREFLMHATAAVQDSGGRVVRYTGDGLIAFFGHPLAREDDAERAVRGALRIVDESARLAAKFTIAWQVRVGVATGKALVGPTIGEGVALEPEIAGPTPHLAARLQAYTSPGTVAISLTTKRLVERTFECVDLDVARLKGYSDPVPVWQVKRELPASARMGSQRIRHEISPLVGRARELGDLLEAWARARAGNGSCIVIRGEPGMGKTRLVRELTRRLEGSRSRVLEYDCSERFQNTALHPLVESLEYDAGFSENDAPEVRLEKLESLLAAHTPRRQLVEVLPRLSGLLGLDVAQSPRLADEGSEQRKERLLVWIQRLLENVARYQPTLVIVENLHWADPTSVDLLARIVARLPRMRVMILITARPEAVYPSNVDRGTDGQTQVIPLSPLEQSSAMDIVSFIAGDRSLPSPEAREIVDRSDGIPLHIEELTKWHLEFSMANAGAQSRSEPTATRQAAVPDSLEILIQARLDACGPVGRLVAQAGASIGIEFSDRLLSALPSLRALDTRAAIKALIEAGIVTARVTTGGVVYRFKHALLRDVARRSLVRNARRSLHTEIVAAIETVFPEMIESRPELLVDHYREAGETLKAVACLKRAAEMALRSSANKEASAHTGHALELLQVMPESAQRKQAELGIYALQGPALAALRGFGAREVGEVYTKAEALMADLDDGDNPLVQRGRTRLSLMQGKYLAARAAAETMASTALSRGDAVRHTDALWQTGLCNLYLGQFETAIRCLSVRPADVDPVQLRDFELTSGVDFQVAYRGYVARLHWLLGRPDEALTELERAIELAESSSNLLTRSQTRYMAAVQYELRGDWDKAYYWAERSIESANLNTQAYWVSLSDMLVGYIAARVGGGRLAAARVRDGFKAYTDGGQLLGLTQFLVWQAESLRLCRDYNGAVVAIEHGLRHATETGERFCEAELHRLMGEVLLEEGGDHAQEAVRSRFERSLEVAGEQGAVGWSLRAATSLYRLDRNGPLGSRARARLADIRARVAGGAGTADVAAADALLSNVT